MNKFAYSVLKKNLFLSGILLLLISCQHNGLKNHVNNEHFSAHFINQKFTDIKGREFTPSQIKSKLILVNFWASWCAPCMQEMPSIVELKKDYSDEQLQVISINTETENQLVQIKKIHQKIKGTGQFITYADQNTKLADSLLITNIPYSVILKNNEVILTIDGPTDFSSPEFRKKINKFLEHRSRLLP